MENCSLKSSLRNMLGSVVIALDRIYSGNSCLNSLVSILRGVSLVCCLDYCKCTTEHWELTFRGWFWWVKVWLLVPWRRRWKWSSVPFHFKMSAKPPRDQGLRKKENFLPQLKPVLPSIKKPHELVIKNHSTSISPTSRAIRERTEAAIKIYSSKQSPVSRSINPPHSKLNQTLPFTLNRKHGKRSISSDCSKQINQELLSLYQPSKFKKFYWSPDLSEYGFVSQDQYMKKMQDFHIVQTARQILKKSHDFDSTSKIKPNLSKVNSIEQVDQPS